MCTSNKTRNPCPDCGADTLVEPIMVCGVCFWIVRCVLDDKCRHIYINVDREAAIDGWNSGKRN